MAVEGRKRMPQTVYIYNYSGTELNIEATSPSCKLTYNGVHYVCTYARKMPSGQSPTTFSLQEGQESGLQAQPVSSSGPASLKYSPLETGVIGVNESTGALQFTPGLPDAAAKRRNPR